MSPFIAMKSTSIPWNVHAIQVHTISMSSTATNKAPGEAHPTEGDIFIRCSDKVCQMGRCICGKGAGFSSVWFITIQAYVWFTV